LLFFHSMFNVGRSMFDVHFLLVIFHLIFSIECASYKNENSYTIELMALSASQQKVGCRYSPRGVT